MHWDSRVRQLSSASSMRSSMILGGVVIESGPRAALDAISGGPHSLPHSYPCPLRTSGTSLFRPGVRLLSANQLKAWLVQPSFLLSQVGPAKAARDSADLPSGNRRLNLRRLHVTRQTFLLQ